MACQQLQRLWQRALSAPAMSRSEQGVPTNEGLKRIARPQSPALVTHRERGLKDWMAPGGRQGAIALPWGS
jgi:hypothetical protein